MNHWVAQGLTGYLSTAVHPNDVESFFYILTRPSRFINKRIIDYANMIVLQLGLLPLEALRSQQLSDASIKALNQLESNLTQITKMSAQDALYHIWVKMGFGTYARETASAFKLDYEECQQIFDTVCCLPNPGESVEGFVGRLSVLKNVAANTRESNVVTLTTCHSAKGLEFPLVILVGAVEGTLPYAKSLGGDDLRGLEEERRLAYVATTRSKDRLLISSPQTMRGRTVQPSRFVSEIRAGILPEEIIEGNSFDHPVWGRCIWGAKTEDIVTIIKPDGEVKRTTIAWLTEKGVL